MSTLAYTISDSRTMLRRNLRRLQRYPSMTLLLIGMPIQESTERPASQSFFKPLRPGVHLADGFDEELGSHVL